MKDLGRLLAILVICLNYSYSIPQSETSYLQNDSLIISEVMFYPLSGNNEFIEICNLSKRKSIDLRNYLLKYYTSSPDSITDAGYGTVLSPGSYAVVLENDYDLSAGIYSGIIPPSALILKISSNSFGSNGMANTTSRPLWFISPESDTLDYYFYSADNASAVSDEKSIMAWDTSSVLWTNSMVKNGTPGYRNSSAKSAYDLLLSGIKMSPIIPVSGDDLELFVKVINNGVADAENFNVVFGNDINKDSVISPVEIISSEQIFLLRSGDTAALSASFYNLERGNYNFICEIEYGADEFLFNNKAYLSVTVAEGIKFSEVVINEIMYAPKNGEPEWLEIYNNSTNEVNLKNWSISDAASSVIITKNDLYLSPGSYLVLSKDSVLTDYYPFDINFVTVTLPALNNTGDALKLLDSLGMPSDTLNYIPVWGGGDNRSLERIDPVLPADDKGNWGTSVNPYRATPGQINSLTQKQNDLSVALCRTKEKYGITGEEVNFEIHIQNKGKNPAPYAAVSLFHNLQKDSVVREAEEIGRIIIENIPAGETKVYEYKYRGVLEGENIFIAIIEYQDDDIFNNTALCNLQGVTVTFGRNDLIINEIMYAPEGEPEWFELFNKSAAGINLKHFYIADGKDTVYLVKNDFVIPSGEYLVISADSINRNIPSGILISAFPALNNTGDKLVIIDSLSRVIDSVSYTQYWGGRKGYSLERNDINGSSADSLNWMTSVNKYRGTPGYVNSVSKKSYDVSVDSISVYPVFPVKGDDAGISVLIKNRGEHDIEFILSIYKNSDQDILIQQENISLPAKDSLWFRPEYIINEDEVIFAEAVLMNDQDTSNNYLYSKIGFGYKPGSVVINEVHYSPGNGEPEWIELYNLSGDTIDITGWAVRDIITTPTQEIIQEESALLPGTYLVIAADSSLPEYHRVIPGNSIVTKLPNLNNDKDGVVLVDNRGITIDSMNYENSENEHRSLERLSFSVSSSLLQNWGYSKDTELSTPGRINSITPKGYDLAIKDIYSDPRFPVNNDQVTIYAAVINNGYNPAADYKIIFTCIRNEPYSDSVTYEISGSSISPGDEMVIKCPEQIILSGDLMVRVAIEYIPDEDVMNNIMEWSIKPGEKQLSLVINEIMHNPLDETPEWIEIYNISGETMNLRNWSVSDIIPEPAKGIITTEDVFIDPGDFLIISGDSSVLNLYPGIKNLLVTRFGNLSSTADGIILYDYRDGIIDSVKYSSSWGNVQGRSIERKNTPEASDDPANWGLSLDPSGATPGKENSVSNIPSVPVNSVVINEIMYEPAPGNCEFVEFFNNSSEKIDIGGWRIEDENGNYYVISDISLIMEPAEYFVFGADSSLFYKYDDIGLFGLAGEFSLGLANSGELILLKDINNFIIDSVYYSDKFHNRNFTITKDLSLERINPLLDGNDKFNWSTCTSPEGATPGKRNSVYTINSLSDKGISVYPNPFSPDNDGWEDFAVINYNFSIEAPQVRMKIFDSQGRLMRTLWDNLPSGSSGSLVYDGYDDKGRALRIGIYILYVEATGVSGTETFKIPFVIARKL